MKTMRYLLAAVLFLAVLSTLRAQERDAARFNQAVYYQSPWRVDWKPDPGTVLYDGTTASPRQIRRYTLAVHPWHLMKDGLKLDFEMELEKPGKWLQLGLMGYHVSRIHVENEPYGYYGRETLASGFDPFVRLLGGGFSAAYKSMLGHTGYYYSAGFLYNYYGVDHDAVRYLPFQENGLTFYERTFVRTKTGFHQPALFLNVGKHVALGKNVFIDLFCGAGYMHSLYSGPKAFTDYLAFGYRGAYFNGGLRLGVIWERKAKL